MQDGARRRMWHELHLDGAPAEEALHTPARIPFQTRLIEEVVDRKDSAPTTCPTCSTSTTS